jgi:cytochrome b subunit of formate dehydrogenase
VGFGLSLSTSIAVIEGLFSKGGAFIRTPKLNLDNSKQKKKIDRAYVAPLSALVWFEIALGIYALITGVVLGSYIGWGMIPLMILYMLGFFYIAGLNLIQHRLQAGN